MLPPLDRSYPAQFDTCKPPVPPADPRAPDLRPVNADYGPNQFEIGVKGPDPALAVGGSHNQ